MTNQIRKLDTDFGITSIGKALEFATYIIISNFCPQSLIANLPRETAKFNIAIAIMTGMELGLSPLNALRSICIINGNPCLWGNAKNALAIQSGNLAKIEYEYFGQEHTMNWGCKVTVYRKNPDMSFQAEFTMKDAEKAGLLGKNNWKNYPKKMLYNRAKQTAFNEVFAECYYNIYSSEEVEDLPMKNITPEQEATTESVSTENNPPQLSKQQVALAKSGWAKPELEKAYRTYLKEDIEEENSIDPNKELINNLFNN
jgi:hypothetical protein